MQMERYFLGFSLMVPATHPPDENTRFNWQAEITKFSSDTKRRERNYTFTSNEGQLKHAFRCLNEGS